MRHVFIIYKRVPDREFASVLTAKVNNAGYDTWQDESNLASGESWRRNIDTGIREAFALIVIVTPESLASEYVTYEWAFALGAEVPVIPILLRKPEKLHPRLEDLHHLDFTGESKPWENLLRDLNRTFQRSEEH